MTRTATQPIVIVHGPSGSGKTKFVLSRPDLFDRPDVAIHGHPKEYAGFTRSRRFGFESGPLHSDPAVLRRILSDESLGVVVLDEFALAWAAFGANGFLDMAHSGRRFLVLSQSLEEAISLMGVIKGFDVGKGFRWKDIPLDGGPLASPGLGTLTESNIGVLPFGFLDGLPSLLGALGYGAAPSPATRTR